MQPGETRLERPWGAQEVVAPISLLHCALHCAVPNPPVRPPSGHWTLASIQARAARAQAQAGIRAPRRTRPRQPTRSRRAATELQVKPLLLARSTPAPPSGAPATPGIPRHNQPRRSKPLPGPAAYPAPAPRLLQLPRHPGVPPPRALRGGSPAPVGAYGEPRGLPAALGALGDGRPAPHLRVGSGARPVSARQAFGRSRRPCSSPPYAQPTGIHTFARRSQGPPR
jgi:hypothetical protein